MSLSSTSTLKSQLIRNLGPQAQAYFDTLASFVSGRISRTEFEDSAKQVLTSATLTTQCTDNITIRCDCHTQTPSHTTSLVSPETSTDKAETDSPSISRT
ncbi:hypothetical protein NLJ89_g9234 [Agrocybe chaxingu]|uniref:Uncharacterized protein n=1 Tax=Agrocybe chaxingu TaxID=84603 RepID=A0A9W8MQ21_9AGAR|nr:hypothetical protein NLJ89_g9234 [Agrocybe chaxingu]